MAYNIIVSPRAQREVENAVDYYALHSSTVPKSFLNLLKETYSSLQTNPFFKIRYKNIRSLKISKFPFSLYFTVDEMQNTVKIISCFHNKRNPNKRPKR
jgi:plasmid stabilization system protein ParE